MGGTESPYKIGSPEPTREQRMTTFLGIDLGSTSIKGGLLDLERRLRGHHSPAPFPDPVPGHPPSHFEIDPQAIVRKHVRC